MLTHIFFSHSLPRTLSSSILYWSVVDVDIAYIYLYIFSYQLMYRRIFQILMVMVIFVVVPRFNVLLSLMRNEN